MPFLPTAAPLLAASAIPLTGDAILVIAGLGLPVIWMLSLLLHPFTACSSCKGTPRLYGAVATRSFRLCPSCGGTGRRLRAGARLWWRDRG